MNFRLITFLFSMVAAHSAEVVPMWWSDPAPPAPELGIADGKEKVRPVRLLQLCPLETFRASAGSEWELLRKIPATEPGKSATWVSYVKVLIPEGADRLGILVVPGDRPQAMPFELGEKAHPWGTTRIVNLTAETVEGWIGKRRFKMLPGGETISDPAKERKTEELVLAAARPGAQPRLLLSSRAILEPEKRSLVFLILRSDGSPDTRAIEETRSLDSALPLGQGVNRLPATPR